MARPIDPYDEEYEGLDPEPFVGAAPVAPVQTYTPDYTPELRPKGSQYGQLASLPLGRSVLDMRPSTFIGEGGGVGGRGGGRADDPGAFDDFGNEDPFGGGLKYNPPVPTAQSTLPPLNAPTMNVPPTNLNLEQLGGGYGQFDPVVGSFLNQFTAPLQRGAFMEPSPEVTGRLQNLLTTGGRIPETMQAFGAGLAGQQTGGLIPTQDLLGQFIARNIESGGNLPIQHSLVEQLQQSLQGAGISPEYARAARETIFDPSMEALQGRLNQMGGGVAALTGGLPAELQRRHERDFMNQMIMAGQQALPQYMNLASQLGQQQFGQAADAATRAGQREQLLGAFGEGGITQGLNFMQQMAATRAAQEDQLGAIIRALLSGMVQPTPGILPTLLASGLGAAGPIMEGVGKLTGIIKPKAG